MGEVGRRRAEGERGKLVIKINLEQLMSWTEEFVDDFNKKERLRITDVVIPCLTKLGQNIFVVRQSHYQSG